MRVPRPSLALVAREGGDFDLDARVEVKIPTLPQKAREGWGTRTR